MTGGWTILACGDPSRGDDGAAFVAVKRLLAVDPPPGVAIRHVGMLEADDIVEATRGGSCLVLDAVAGIEPGAIIERPLAALLARDAPAPASSHAVPFALVVGLAEALGARLAEATFLGIGGRDFDLGEGLSEPVHRGMDAYVLRIAETVREEAGSCA